MEINVSSNPYFLARCVVEVIRYGASLLKTRTIYHRSDRSLHLGIAAVERRPRCDAENTMNYSTQVSSAQVFRCGDMNLCHIY